MELRVGLGPTLLAAYGADPDPERVAYYRLPWDVDSEALAGEIDTMLSIRGGVVVMPVRLAVSRLLCMRRARHQSCQSGFGQHC